MICMFNTYLCQSQRGGAPTEEVVTTPVSIMLEGLVGRCGHHKPCPIVYPTCDWGGDMVKAWLLGPTGGSLSDHTPIEEWEVRNWWNGNHM